jgi:hypothetical protein
MATPTTLPATFVAGNVLTAAQMNNLRGAFRVLQVISTTKTDTFTTTSTTFTNVTGLTATITPSSTSSQILVIASVTSANNVGTSAGYLRLARGGTAIFVGDAAGSRTQGNKIEVAVNTQSINACFAVLDNPASTSALTYSVQGRTDAGSFFINRSSLDTDSVGFPRSASSITVMEISL